MSLTKILIANRSEVALRIQATCKAHGLQTVAVYTKEDCYSSCVYNADQAYQLTQPGYLGYLDQEEIINIALKSGADALHPGYGFLSENAAFAQKVIDAGLVWVGPHPEAIRLMGDKVVARQLMEQVEVPVVPGAACNDLTDAGKKEAKQKAITIGFPVILKDPKSGGGKGMRKINSDDDFDRCWDAVVSESRKLTGSTVLLLEKYVTNSRHVEVQVAGNGKNYVHFFERECSIQRRHQKIIEEAPCQFISEKTKQILYDAALKCAASVNYDSIGTVEFLVTPEEEVYFLEMNTRLQVEHGVTEMITGFDLVALQLDLAGSTVLRHSELRAHVLRDDTHVSPQDEREGVVSKHLLSEVEGDASILPLQQDITKQGNAIQCRVYAENPEQNFTPATGTIKHIYFPDGPFNRLEHDLDVGKQVTPFFDPMLGKVLTCGATREQATEQMRALLSQSKFEGVITNIQFLHDVIASSEFASGDFHTQLISHTNFVEKLKGEENRPSDEEFMLAGLAMLLAVHEQLKEAPRQIGALNQQVKRGWKEQQWR